jgi:ribose 5-phosphate isomerase A
MIVIADESKWVETLGRFPLPIEIMPFGVAATRRAIVEALKSAGADGPLEIRKGRDGLAFVTDGGHWIVDARLGSIKDPHKVATALAAIPGVVEHGLFLGLARTVILAGAQGIRVIDRPTGRE